MGEPFYIYSCNILDITAEYRDINPEHQFFPCNLLKAIEKQNHMIDMVFIFSINLCPCKIRYQVKTFWDRRKGTKEGLLTLEFL